MQTHYLINNQVGQCYINKQQHRNRDSPIGSTTYISILGLERILSLKKLKRPTRTSPYQTESSFILNKSAGKQRLTQVQQSDQSFVKQNRILLKRANKLYEDNPPSQDSKILDLVQEQTTQLKLEQQSAQLTRQVTLAQQEAKITKEKLQQLEKCLQELSGQVKEVLDEKSYSEGDITMELFTARLLTILSPLEDSPLGPLAAALRLVLVTIIQYNQTQQALIEHQSGHNYFQQYQFEQQKVIRLQQQCNQLTLHLKDGQAYQDIVHMNSRLQNTIAQQKKQLNSLYCQANKNAKLLFVLRKECGPRLDGVFSLGDIELGKREEGQSSFCSSYESSICRLDQKILPRQHQSPLKTVPKLDFGQIQVACYHSDFLSEQKHFSESWQQEVKQMRNQ